MGTTLDTTYKLKVLAVDDDPFILDTVVKYLTARDLHVISTTDPETVIPLASKENPRLIISDIAMPGMDGLTLLKNLKGNPATCDIPLILLTSSRNAADIQEGLNSGAEAYLIKPIDWDISWPKIQAILLRT